MNDNERELDLPGLPGLFEKLVPGGALELMFQIYVEMPRRTHRIFHCAECRLELAVPLELKPKAPWTCPCCGKQLQQIQVVNQAPPAGAPLALPAPAAAAPPAKKLRHRRSRFLPLEDPKHGTK